MAKRKTLTDAEVRAQLEAKSESDDNHLSIDSVYDSNNNDAPYIPEGISSYSSFHTISNKVL